MRGNIVKKLIVVIVATVVIALSSVMSCFAGEGFYLFPVPKLFTADDNINQDFKEFIGKNKQYGGSYFAEQLKALFPAKIAATIDNANKFKTFVVSAQIPRASRYDIKKPDGTIDIYLPITMSIYFTNILTGEVLYSYSYTNYSVYTAVANAVNPKMIDKLYRKNFEDLVSVMLNNAKDKFKPFAIQAKTARIWKGYVVLDKGRDGGLAPNDSLSDAEGNQVNVIHAGIGYAVAIPILGVLREGAVFTKLSNQTTDTIRKPKVVILRVDNPSAFPEQSAQQFFSDSLGSAAQFSILPVQRNFYSVQDYVIRATKIEQKIRYERELPDYFIRIHILPPSYVRYATNKKYVNNDSYTVTVFGELLDTSGRVLFSADSTETLEDQVVSNITFANEARLQVVVKNALIGLGKKFAEDVKFKHLELAVESVSDDNLSVNDPYNVLAPGVGAKLFRNIGKILGIREDVLVPIWEVSAVGTDGSSAQVGKVLATNTGAPEPENGDLIVMEAVQPGSADKVYRVKMCLNCTNLGGEAFDNCAVLARYAVSENLTYPVYAGKEFSVDVARIVSDSVFKKRPSRATVPDPAYCVEPVYKIVKVGDGGTGQKYSVTAGFKVNKGDSVAFKKGMEQKITVPAMVGYEAVSLEMELNKDTFGLWSNIAKSARISK
jgi:hypothetical protein